ncbi:MAG: beta-ketoacyl-[acyl-carrier-protein] synthase family protein, partial [Bacteroidales bacterium]
KQQIYVTGLGIVSGIGNNTAETVASIRSLQSGIGNIQHLNTQHAEIPCSEVKLSEEQLKILLKISPEEVITRTSLLGMVAAKEAFAQAHLSDFRHYKGLRLGFLNGTTVGGMEKSEQYYPYFTDPESNLFSDYIEAHDCGACTEKIADYLGQFDYVATTSTACSSAVNTLILAVNLLQSGFLDCVIAGGTECLSKFHLNGFNTLMILDPQHCKPFDKNRAGLNLGEGAAYLVIENEKSRSLRNSKPLCTIAGWGNSCDAFHQTASSPDGKGAVLSMSQALQMSGLQPSDIDYINAHGTGTGNNDESEGTAVMTIFGDHIPPISSTKSFTGHTTSAAGGVESVFYKMAMKNHFLPPNLNFAQPIEKLSFKPIENLVENVVLKHVLNNSFGFGGNNSSIIFSDIETSHT